MQPPTPRGRFDSRWFGHSNPGCGVAASRAPVSSQVDADGLRGAFRRLIYSAILAAALGPSGPRGLAMPAAPAGVSETGAPSFVVMGPEALGLSSNPTDVHLLRDGRILVVSRTEIAFGDGLRWEAFRAVDDQEPIVDSVAVDGDGQIYTGTNGGFGRIDLLEGARWRTTPMVKMPGSTALPGTTLVSVAALTDHWYWYGGNGSIVSWRPGEAVRTVGNVGAVETIFNLGKAVFVSDQSSGELYRLTAGGNTEFARPADSQLSEGVTCAVPFGPGQLLLGTVSAGLRIFDGRDFRSFGPPGLLNDGHRITDLCSAGQGYFAASIDAVGIVFFDRDGHTVQVLDGTLDRRVARVRRLIYADNGVLWALLNNGLARVEFPSQISHYEAFIASGLDFAQPLRHAGQLWILADGHGIQGVYDASGRLERFKDNTPQGQYLFTLTDVDGQLFASNEIGIFVYESNGWRLVLPGIVNARVGVTGSIGNGILYVARGEYGVIRRTGQDYSAERIPVPGLIDSYNSLVDSSGVGWLELGASRVGRMDPNGGKPTFQIFGLGDGLGSGWAEIYLVDGVARFHMANEVYLFDGATRKFVVDRELLARIPQFANAWGRPVIDSSGRFWYTVNGAATAIDHTKNGGDRLVSIPSIGFGPTGYTAEDHGVVWMFEKGRLARLDPTLPRPPDLPLRALITSVQFSASNRQIFAPGPALDAIDFADNSLIIHFAAPANPFLSAVTFEVLLEGAGTQWVSTGAVGTATFYRLKEGDYMFHVRPVGGEGAPGVEARLRFTVRPPWFRTGLAWSVYFALAAVLLAVVIGLPSHLQRRKSEELEKLVAKRTGQLNATNAQLGRQIGETTEKSHALSVSEERYRLLNTMLEDRVRKRTAELSLSNEELQQRELLFRLIFEHAPVGISWKRMDLGGAFQINPTFQRILDLNRDTLTDYSELADLVHPDDAERQVEMNQRIASGETDRYALEERFVLNGRIVWGRLSVAVIRDPKGRIIQEIGILQDITSRKAAEEELASAHKVLLEASRHAGMAEVATGVLHNVGNVLNSVNVSATLAAEQVRHTKGANVAKLAALFEQHKSDLGVFLTKDSRGQMIPAYLGTLAEMLGDEQKTLITELEHLRKNVEHIKDIVAMQQSYARTSGVMETVSVPDLVEDALRINAGSLARHDIHLVRDYEARPVVSTDKHKVMQILINLVRNSKYACDESGRIDKKITVRTTSDDHCIRISVSDNGVGIPAENLMRIFNHGFTTRKSGHGFGLHSGALAAKELGGKLTVHSDGLGHGATFVLELPFKPGTSTYEDPSV